jgi:hypothetical protein
MATRMRCTLIRNRMKMEAQNLSSGNSSTRMARRLVIRSGLRKGYTGPVGRVRGVLRLKR